MSRVYNLKLFFILLTVLVFICNVSNVYARDIYVDIGSAGSGSSWDDATSLQNALNGAVSGDIIRVKEGVYKPGTDVNDNFTLINGAEIYGGFANSLTGTDTTNRDPETYKTILSGDIAGDDIDDNGDGIINDTNDIQGTNNKNVVIGENLDNTTIFDGFYITAGKTDSQGGGMYLNNSSPVINNIIFRGNSAAYGGGMNNNNSSSSILDNVIFIGNSANYGGGMYNYSSSPVLKNVTFSSNSTNNYGGGIYNNYHSSPALDNVTFNNNEAGYGGGIYNNNYSSPTINNVVFNNNISNYGGGIYNIYSTPNFTNVTFSGNSAEYGGGIYNYHSSPVLKNVTFSGNISDTGGGMRNYYYSSPTLTNVTFSGNNANNGGGIENGFNSSSTLINVILDDNTGGNCDGNVDVSSKYNLIDDNTCGLTDGDNGNIIGTDKDANLDVLKDNGGYTKTRALLEGSLAIDAGICNNDDNRVPLTDQRGVARPQGLGCDIGAYEYNPPIDGICGTSDNNSFYTAPTENLCSEGSATSVTGDGPWNWSCTGSNGGITASCSANKSIDGTCGTSNGSSFYTAPTNNLCSDGFATSVTGDGPWNWSCTGSNGGTTASCSANKSIDGTCGTSDGSSFYTAPTNNLCSDGFATVVTGDGPWNWSCTGSNGGTTASCSANKSIDGTCGTSDGSSFYTTPTDNLCLEGFATSVTGDGPWNWSCTGSNGGTTSSCSANIIIPKIPRLKVDKYDFCKSEHSETVGIVISDDGKIDCGEDCGETYNGETVTLTAIPANGYVFVGWKSVPESVNCETNPECTIRMNKYMEIKAYFAKYIESPDISGIFIKQPPVNIATCETPIGVGFSFKGVPYLDLNIKLPGFVEPMDVYLGVYAPSLSDDIYLFNELGKLVPLKDELVPWITNTMGGVFAWPLGRIVTYLIPGIHIPDGEYQFYLVVAPSGSNFSKGYYLWKTNIEVQ